MSGGDDLIAGGNHGVGLQVGQLRPVGIVAGEDRAGAGGADKNGNTRIEVGDQQHPRHSVPDPGDPPHQPLAGDHRLPLADTGTPAGAQQQAVGEGAARIGDHPGGDETGVRLGNELQQLPERRVFHLQVAGDRLPLEQVLPVLMQPRVLVVKGDPALHVLGGPRDGVHRLRQDFENRRDRLVHLHSKLFHENGVGLAEHHQGARCQNKTHVGEAMGNKPDRPNHSVV